MQGNGGHLLICDCKPKAKLGLWRLCVPHLVQSSFLQKKSNVANVF